MPTLIIALPLSAVANATEYSYVVSPDGVTAGAHGTAPAALLPALGSSGNSVVAVIPVAALSWHPVTLPKGLGRWGAGTPRIRAVLDGLLEEHLLDEAEAVHLALDPQAHSGGNAWVAVCNKAWLQGHLTALDSAQRPVGRLLPEVAPPLAAEAEAAPVWRVLGEADHAWLCAMNGSDLGLWPLQPGQALPSHLALTPDTQLIAEPAVAALAEQIFQRPCTLELPSARWLQALAGPWDLAQFDLASSGGSRAWRRLAQQGQTLWRGAEWRVARWGVALLLLAHLVGLNAWAWHEKNALSQQRQQISGLLTHTFPKVQVVVDAPLQMHRELAALQQASGASSSRDLEAMLGALARAVPVDRSLQAIDFSVGQLKFKGLHLSREETTQLTATLQSQGFALQADGDGWALRPEGTP